MASTKSNDLTISLKAVDKLLTFKTAHDVVDNKVINGKFKFELSPLFQRENNYYPYPAWKLEAKEWIFSHLMILVWPSLNQTHYATHPFRKVLQSQYFQCVTHNWSKSTLNAKNYNTQKDSLKRI